MSATLGPVHYLMFERIKLAAARQQELADFAHGRMSPSQQAELEERWQSRHQPPQGELQDLIGDSPIHAWLKHQLEAQLLSEAGLWSLLTDRPERLAQVQAQLFDHGQRVGEVLLQENPAIQTDAGQLLQAVDRVLLLSLPCDKVSQVIAQSERSFIVRRDLLFHAPIWERAGLPEASALACLESWMQGLVAAVPGVRLVRAVVQSEGRELHDDRVSLACALQEA